MNCQDVQKFAYTYLDAEFDGRERGEFETHLRMCPPCHAAVERDAVFRDLVRQNLAVATTCPTLKTRLQARMDCEQRRRSTTAVAVPIALVASMGAVVILWQWQTTVIPGTQVAPGDAVAAMQQKPGQLNSGTVVNSVRAVAVLNKQPVAVMQPGSGQNAGAGQNAANRPVIAQNQHLARANPPAIVQPARPQNPPSPQVQGAGAGLQLVSANAAENYAADTRNAGEVLRGAIPSTSLVDRSPFGAVRSEQSLRTMARVHAAALPPEVGGPATKVQRYLAHRVPGIGPLPLSEGAGVELLGARLAVMGPQPVVVYSYRAYGTPLTVFSRAKATDVDDPEVEPTAPGNHDAANRDSGVLLDQRAGLHLLHVVSRDRVLTLVSELSASALLPLVPKATWL